MKTFKIDISKFDEISDKEVREKTTSEMFDLIYDKIYYIDGKGMLIFPTFEAFFEATRFDVNEFYYSTHTDEDTKQFMIDYPHIIEFAEVVDRDKEIENRKNKTTRSKVAIERYKEFNLEEEDLSAIKDMSQSGSFGFHSIMELFEIDYETLCMIENDNSIKIK